MATAGTLVVELQAETSHFHAQMTASGAAIERLTSGVHTSRMAVHGLARGMEDLSATALGATGPIGHVVGALVALAGPELLIAGGLIGALALAMEHFKKNADDAAKAAEKFLESLARIGPHAAMVAQQIKLAGLQEQIDQAEALKRQLDTPAARLRAAAVAAAGGAPLVWTPRDEMALQQLKQAAAEAQQRIGQLGQEAERTGAKISESIGSKWLKDFLDSAAVIDEPLNQIWAQLVAHAGPAGVRAGTEFAKAWDQIVGQRLGADRTLRQTFTTTGLSPETAAELFRPPTARFPAFGATGIGESARQAQAAASAKAYLEAVQETARIEQAHLTPLQQYQQTMEILNRAEALGVDVTRARAAAEQDYVQKAELARLKTQMLAIAIVNAVAGAIAAVVGGGGAGGFLSALGGVVGLIPGGQIAGAVIAGLGGIVSAEEAGANRRHAESESNADRRNQDLLNAMRQGVVYVQLPSGGLVSPHDPAFQDWFLRALESAAGKQVIIIPGSG